MLRAWLHSRFPELTEVDDIVQEFPFRMGAEAAPLRNQTRSGSREVFEMSDLIPICFQAEPNRSGTASRSGWEPKRLRYEIRHVLPQGEFLR